MFSHLEAGKSCPIYQSGASLRTAISKDQPCQIPQPHLSHSWYNLSWYCLAMPSAQQGEDEYTHTSIYTHTVGHYR